MILNIETSTTVCSVALSEKEHIIAEKVSYEVNSHSKLLAQFVDEILKENNIKASDIQAVAVSEGPGSYTGLRIGVSLAKGIAYASKIPLIAVDTLQILAAGLITEHSDLLVSNPVLVPMIDARRMEVYTAFFEADLTKISETTNMIIDEFSFQTPLQYRPMIFFGDGAKKCSNVIIHQNAIFVENIFPLAKNMAQLAHSKLQNKEFVDVAYFEPFYLKPFIATIPKNKLK